MTDAEERKFLIQAIRLLRTVRFEDHQLFKVVKYAKEVQEVIEEWEERKDTGVGILVMKMRKGENTRHVLAQLIVTMLWSIPSLIPSRVAKGLCEIRVDTESAFQDALKVLQNIRPSDRVVLSQILDLVADVAQFQIEKDSEAPLRLGKIFGPVLLRGAKAKPETIVRTIITLTQNRKDLHLSMPGSNSTSTSSSSVPVLVAEPSIPIANDDDDDSEEVTTTTATAPPMEFITSSTETTSNEPVVVPAPTLPPTIQTPKEEPPTQTPKEEKVDDEVKLPKVDMRPMPLNEQHAATERVLDRVHQVLMGDTPEARARRLKRERERADRTAERLDERSARREEQQRRAASRAARRRAAVEERNRKRLERSEERRRGGGGV